jgi:hypothetical protein
MMLDAVGQKSSFFFIIPISLSALESPNENPESTLLWVGLAE